MSVLAEFSNEPWVGVDFDGTLVTHCFPETGEPVQPVIDFIRELRAHGVCVKIMTARVGPHGTHYADGTPIEPDFIEKQVALLEQWSIEHLGEKLPVTATKDFCMVGFVDDRCIQVVPDTGVRVDGRPLTIEHLR